MEAFDPYDVRPAVTATHLDALDADPLYLQALDVALDVQNMYPFIRERPRYESLWDQAARASSSVALNIAQGFGKLRGFMKNDFLCSRGEGYELYAALSILPADLAAPIKDKLRSLLRDLDVRILAIPERYERPSHLN